MVVTNLNVMVVYVAISWTPSGLQVADLEPKDLTQLVKKKVADFRLEVDL